MRSSLLTISLLLLSVSALLAQTDRGTITGTMSDASGAVIPGVTVVATNSQTGARYETISTETGNYVLAQLPAGIYELTAELAGFKKYVRHGIAVQVAQTLRVNVELEVGAASESVTVAADAPLLRTESGDLSHNVATSRIDELPILGTGSAAAGSSGIRNPIAAIQLLPGTYLQPNSNVRINGAPVNSEAIRIEGQDATNTLVPFAQAQTQPSVDAIQEVSVQTSNYAAEFGQAGGGIFNYTVKSGTNDFHGTAYDYAAHEKLNAGQPFTSAGGPNKRPFVRRHDWGFTFGGPVSLGKLYDGHNRTFFFVNFERYHEDLRINNQQFTIPTLAYRNGDFSSVLTGRQLGVDPLGRPIIEGTIYDPATTRVVNGQVVRDPFPNNQIPLSRVDPVALKIQSLFPQPDTPGPVNNFRPSYPSTRTTPIPAVKFDHNLTERQKLSFYWSRTGTGSQFSPQFGGSDGLPNLITEARGTFIESFNVRLNYDNSLTPTLLLHIGAGYLDNDFRDDAPVTSFDAEKELGLKGGILKRQVPRFTGLTAARGGSKNLGPNAQSESFLAKPTGNAALTWIRNNHTYKIGTEYRQDGLPVTSFTRAAGFFDFSAAQTGLPYLQTTTLNGGNIGFPYASFLLGLVNDGNISSPSNVRFGKKQWGLFVQDTWKVTRRMTLDYGLRWDYFTYLKELHGRAPAFSSTTANPAAGGLLGASIFEGDGPGHCNCNFADNYPYAIGPRAGLAYQVTPKWVARAGFGISYSGTSNRASANGVSINPYGASAFGEAATRLQDGIPLTGEQVAFPKINSGLFPLNGNPIDGGAPEIIDANAGRPGRIFQWSVGIQREITPNLVVEASYVGNRGTWLQADLLKDINALTPERIASFGLDINNPDDRALLISQLNSPLAAQRGFNKPPYAAFPLSATVAQSLRPYPQFERINSLYAPLGNSWYDSLQLKATQRLSHGLDFTSAFTWQKELTLGADNENGLGAAVNDVFDRSQNKQISSFSRPITFVVAANYRIPTPHTDSLLSALVSDWTFGTVLRYASGLPIRVPLAQNGLNTLLFRGGPLGSTSANGTNAVRVPGEPLFLKDLNDPSSFDPNRDFVLNPKAWTDPAPGHFGNTASYLSDYRGQRRPQESMSLTRTFRLNHIREGASLSIRIEFENVFNRQFRNDPDSPNAKATQTRDANGSVVSGFGRINTATTFSNFQPRQGQIIARFRF